MGSASELEYLLLLSKELGFVNGNAYGQFESDVTEVKRMLASFIDKLKADRCGLTAMFREMLLEAWDGLSSSALRIYHFRHETGAAFGAIEAGFASGWPTVLFTTTGPGLTNALRFEEAIHV